MDIKVSDQEVVQAVVKAVTDRFEKVDVAQITQKLIEESIRFHSPYPTYVEAINFPLITDYDGRGGFQFFQGI